MIEIERKFVVDKDKVASIIRNKEGKAITQAYLTESTEISVRVRKKGDKGFLTIKGKSEGIRRVEFEYEIPAQDVEQMLAAMPLPRVEKTRYEVEYAGKCWEIDWFHGENEGLVLAEVELTHETESIAIPPWVSKEVSDDARYFNQYLALHPFKTWANR